MKRSAKASADVMADQASTAVRRGLAKPPSDEELRKTFLTAGQYLRDGLSSKAEDLLLRSLAKYTYPPDEFADLKRLLSFTLETLGKYKESLEALRPFEDEEVLGRLKIETQVKVTTQLAVAYNNVNDHPKAVTLLKENLAKAEEHELRHLIGRIDNALARVYRKLNECPICRDYAEKSLAYFRETGDWLGMAEAYREIALSYHQEGSSEKSLEYFDLGVQIIGERSAPFMLGKLYTELSGAYWFLRRPQEGIACLEKSIEFFERTEHLLNSVIAYNNLGINLVHMGDWARAEKMIDRAYEIAVKINHVHKAGILDSLGELKILRGDLDEAEKLLLEAVKVAIEGKREWYAAQSMRNLARCFLAQKRYQQAADKARETIELCARIGDKHYTNMAGLVYAESCLMLGGEEECENYLQVVEENDPTSDFFVLGNIQRIRGLAAMRANDTELALHHFNRSLTLFETADDIYHIGLANYLIGTALGSERPRPAAKHLNKALEIFKRLGVSSLTASSNEKLAELKNSVATTDIPDKTGSHSNSSQLLTARLAEATASRELLFREFVAVLRQESKAGKLIIAEPDDKNQIRPFITHGYTSDESNLLTRKFAEALSQKSERAFAKSKNFAVVNLKGSSSTPAYLFISPAAGAVMNDGSSLSPLTKIVELGMDVIALREKERTLLPELESDTQSAAGMLPGFIHSSLAMAALVEEIYKIRSSDVTVLVTGESGTGKELVSRAIHTLSNRKDKIFVPFNCTAVPKELAEGHLFGYRKGAFTGAVTDSPGMIRAADGGTLFLDEVGDLPLDVQPKLLRFLQEGEVQPIGEKRPIKVDVRVIAATNMPLEEKVANGTFREDLYYRLNVIRLRVPPLRERRSEIPAMVTYYVEHYSQRFGKRGITITPQTIDLLMVCDWEGNVRQLTNELQRIIARAVDNETITPDHLSPELRRSAKPLAAFAVDNVKPITTFDQPIMPFANLTEGQTLEEAVGELEMMMIRSALSRNNWNMSRTAVELGLTRRGLYLKLARYGIEKAA
jgi:transcriptional regulator with GAF, ATPase, and Fis domain/tetratricopeptide (TPR) repeat protein